eukprot:gene32268-41820_t
MFSGLMDTMLKSDSKKPKLITREIVFLGMSMDSMAALKSCRIVEDIQAVLGMKISFSITQDNSA